MLRSPFRGALRRLALAAALGTLAIPPAASADLLVVGIDRKFAFDEAGRRRTLEPGRDAVLVYDLAAPEAPRLVGSLPLENSIVGPPTNIAVTPDQRLALVANSVHAEPAPGGGWRTGPGDEVFIVDLAARPLRVAATVKVGAQPSGIAVDRTGARALVANRAGNSVSVLAIRDGTATVTDTLPLGEPIVSVAFTPDGRRALAVKYAGHRVTPLAVSAEGRVTVAGPDITVGPWPYTVTITADGRRALVGNTGNQATSDGSVDTVSVIDLVADPPRTVDHVPVGDAVEGVAASPAGGLALATVLQGSYDAPVGAWFRHPVGRVVALSTAGERVRVAGSVDVGAFPEGVAFAPDGRFAYVGNFASDTITVLRVEPDGRLADTGRDIRLPGPPASLRVGSQ